MRRPAVPRWKTVLCATLCSLGLSLLPPPAQAMDSSEDAIPDAYVPARVRAFEGSPMIQRERELDRVEVSLNTPVYPGDVILSQDGRMEFQLPDGTLLWIGPETRIEAAAWHGSESEESTVVRLHEGLVEIDYDVGEAADFRVDTPEASVYLLGPGRFRIETGNGSTELTARRGTAELSGEEGSTLVRSGQRSRLSAGYRPEDPQPFNTLRLDEFDAWCDERAETYIVDNSSNGRPSVEEVPVPVRHYVSELDHYGSWQFMLDYGWVWRPTVYQVGWRPYYSGYWAPYRWGWSWVSYEPWGWVPYHYGRWSWVTTAGWVWIPGGVYANAWVSWAVTPTYIGWCPLDYYNRPVYVHAYGLPANHYGSGWNFLPLNRWGYRDLQRSIVRADRVPLLQGAITTRTLPRFPAAAVRARPETLQKVVREKSSIVRTLPAGPRVENESRISFREADRREAAFAPDSRPRGSAHSPREGRGGKISTRAVPDSPPAGAVRVGGGPSRQSRPAAVPQSTAPSRESRPPVDDNRGSRGPRRVAPEAPGKRSTAEPTDPSQRVLKRILSTPSPRPPSNGPTPRVGPAPRGRGATPESSGTPAGSGIRKEGTGQGRARPPSATRTPSAKAPPASNPKAAKDPKKDKP